MISVLSLADLFPNVPIRRGSARDDAGKTLILSPMPSKCKLAMKNAKYSTHLTVFFRSVTHKSLRISLEAQVFRWLRSSGLYLVKTHAILDFPNRLGCLDEIRLPTAAIAGSYAVSVGMWTREDPVTRKECIAAGDRTRLAWNGPEQLVEGARFWARVGRVRVARLSEVGALDTKLVLSRREDASEIHTWL